MCFAKVYFITKFLSIIISKIDMDRFIDQILKSHRGA